MNTTDNIRTKAAGLRLMGFDVDGVMTDGSLYFTPQGDEIKAFSILDGHGLKMLQAAGITVVIITGRSSAMVELRAKNLGIEHVFQDVKDKRATLRHLRDALGIAPGACGYMGDDIVDLPILLDCGFSASVPNGHSFVHKHVDLVTERSGGAGAVREVCDFILAAQGKLDDMLAAYLAP